MNDPAKVGAWSASGINPDSFRDKYIVKNVVAIAVTMQVNISRIMKGLLLMFFISDTALPKTNMLSGRMKNPASTPIVMSRYILVYIPVTFGRLIYSQWSQLSLSVY